MALEVGELQAGEQAALVLALGRACALRAAESNGVGVPDAARVEAAYRWCFEGNPAGFRSIVVRDSARRDGEHVVGHVGALPHVVWLGAGERLFAELVFDFVLPEASAGLKNPGAYVSAMKALFDGYGGVQGDLVYYGWPTRAGWRLAKEKLKAEVVRTQHVLALELDSAHATRFPGSGSPGLTLERLERFDHQARWLWDRTCPAWGASVVRDEAFLNWRFVEHPEAREYTLFGVRDGEGILRGFAAYRLSDRFKPNSAWLVDWLVPTEEPAVGELLLGAALSRARTDGASRLATQLVEWSPWFETFQRWGFRVEDARTFLWMRGFARKFDELWLRDQWWCTRADSVE